jgi:hypothetical protein
MPALPRPATLVTPRPTSRAALVAEARAHLLRHGWPRLQTALLLAGAGGAAFLVSVALLASGVDRMGLRYGLAALAGYATFLMLVGLWIAWHRGSSVEMDTGLDVLLQSPSPTDAEGVVTSMFQGGTSGGGGGGASFGDVATSIAPRPALGDAGRVATDEGSWFNVDLDDLGVVLLVAACAAAGIVAVGYVVYAAPILLAEVAVDAAVMGTLYRRLRKEDARHWSRGVLRGTWVAALIVVLSAAGVGYVAQRAVPEARSIGGVVQGLPD